MDMTVKKKNLGEFTLNSEKSKPYDKSMDSEGEKTFFFDPMAVTWMEKYNDKLEKIWSTLPSFIAKFIASCAIFLLGATLRGEMFN